MNIWYNKDITLDHLSHLGANTMSQHLGMRFTEIGEDYLKMSMPVDQRTKQPYGLLHGGASVALAETIGSIASFFVIDQEKYITVGIEVNANHVRGAKEGLVFAVCRPIHLGSGTHVWDIRIHDEKEKLICISRLTVAILEKRK